MHTTILPPEWAPQSGVMLTWPHEDTDWGDDLPEVEPVLLAMAKAITRFEDLCVATASDSHRVRIAGLLADAAIPGERLHLHIAPSNDSWCRDHGPITVRVAEQPRLLDFTFNGWGGKYRADLDNRITQTLHTAGAFGATPLESLSPVLEGGSIESDGEGTILTTSRCLLSPKRNGPIDRRQVKELLARTLGARRVLWLDHGYLAGDDTDSHIDTLARFCDARTITYVRCTDPKDEHFSDLAAMEKELQSFSREDGAAYRLVPLPWPQAAHGADGRRLPATYANFLIINGAVLVPTYNDPADVDALRILAGCFPGREVIGIDCRSIIRQNGSLHCLTMQLPEGVLRSQS